MFLSFLVNLHRRLLQRREQESPESESRKSAMFESALDCVITIDHEGNVLEFNPAAEQTFGYARDDVVGKQMADIIIPPSLRDGHHRGLAHYLATGEGPIFGKRLELTAMRADGSEFPVELAVARVDLPGQPVFTGFIRDITERKQAEEEIQALNESLERRVFERTEDLEAAQLGARRQASINAVILNAATDEIGLRDLEGRIVFANEAAQRGAEELGVPLDVNGEQRADLLADRTTDPEAYRRNIAEFSAHPDADFTFEYTIAESRRSFVSYLAPVADEEGRPLGHVFVVREVTAERKAEELKSELVATVSHELRTPLSSIVGFAELLVDRDIDSEKRDRYAATIHGEAKRLTELINDFLDLQRIEEGDFTLSIEHFDLAAVLREQVGLFAGQSAAHKVELTESNGELTLLGERDRVAQVVGNLVSNAIKYSPAGGTVSIVAEARSEAVRVSITDTGLGIPADQQRMLFTKFYRVDSSDTRAIGGTGLGLALCREIVEAHGGSIGFDSVEGEGSSFWFELPAPHQQNGEPPPAASTGRNGDALGRLADRTVAE